MLQKLFHDFVTLFIAIAGHESIRQQRQIATQGVVVAAAILLAVLVIAYACPVGASRCSR